MVYPRSRQGCAEGVPEVNLCWMRVTLLWLQHQPPPTYCPPNHHHPQKTAPKQQQLKAHLLTQGPAVRHLAQPGRLQQTLNPQARPHPIKDQVQDQENSIVLGQLSTDQRAILPGLQPCTSPTRGFLQMSRSYLRMREDSNKPSGKIK